MHLYAMSVSRSVHIFSLQALWSLNTFYARLPEHSRKHLFIYHNLSIYPVQGEKGAGQRGALRRSFWPRRLRRCDAATLPANPRRCDASDAATLLRGFSPLAGPRLPLHCIYLSIYLALSAYCLCFCLLFECFAVLLIHCASIFKACACMCIYVCLYRNE